MEDPLLTDQQIENGIDWTPMAVSARAMTPHAVRAFYEDQITRDRALIQTLVNALNMTEALDNAPSERVAKRICEIIYELHRKG